MNRIIVFTLFVILGISCGNQNTDEGFAIGKNRAAIEMDIEGMVCEMGCVSSIKKELKNLEGVHQYSIDFENSSAKVEFHSDKISKEDVVKSIETLNDGMYKVNNVRDVCAVDCDEVEDNGGGKSKEEPVTSPKTVLNDYTLPNLFSVIQKLIQ